MEHWQTEFIRRNLPQLVQVTDCNQRLLAFLTESSLVSDEERYILEWKGSHEGSSRQSMTLYEILMTRINGFEGLITALEKCKQEKACKLLKEGLQYRLSTKSEFDFELMTLDIHEQPSCTTTSKDDVNLEPPRLIYNTRDGSEPYVYDNLTRLAGATKTSWILRNILESCGMLSAEETSSLSKHEKEDLTEPGAKRVMDILKGNQNGLGDFKNALKQSAFLLYWVRHSIEDASFDDYEGNLWDHIAKFASRRCDLERNKGMMVARYNWKANQPSKDQTLEVIIIDNKEYNEFRGSEVSFENGTVQLRNRKLLSSKPILIEGILTNPNSLLLLVGEMYLKPKNITAVHTVLLVSENVDIKWVEKILFTCRPFQETPLKWTELSDRTQKQIKTGGQVMLRSQSLKVSDLYRHLNGTQLNTMIQTQSIHICEPLADTSKEDGCYVRRFFRASKFNLTEHKKQSAFVVFNAWSIDIPRISELVQCPVSFVEDFLTLSYIPHPNQVIATGDEDIGVCLEHLEKLSIQAKLKLSEGVKLLKYDAEGLFYILPEHELLRSKSRFIVISGEAGEGKSTVLRKISSTSRLPTCFFSAKDLTDNFAGANNDVVTRKKMADFIIKGMVSTDFDRLVLERVFKTLKLVVLIDDVNSNDVTSLCNTINLVLGIKQLRVVLATRNSSELDLWETVNCSKKSVVELIKMSVSDNANLIERLWDIDNILVHKQWKSWNAQNIVDKYGFKFRELPTSLWKTCAKLYENRLLRSNSHLRGKSMKLGIADAQILDEFFESSSLSFDDSIPEHCDRIFQYKLAHIYSALAKLQQHQSLLEWSVFDNVRCHKGNEITWITSQFFSSYLRALFTLQVLTGEIIMKGAAIEDDFTRFFIDRFLKSESVDKQLLNEMLGYTEKPLHLRLDINCFNVLDVLMQARSCTNISRLMFESLLEHRNIENFYIWCGSAAVKDVNVAELLRFMDFKKQDLSSTEVIILCSVHLGFSKLLIFMLENEKDKVFMRDIKIRDRQSFRSLLHLLMYMSRDDDNTTVKEKKVIIDYLLKTYPEMIHLRDYCGITPILERDIHFELGNYLVELGASLEDTDYMHRNILHKNSENPEFSMSFKCVFPEVYSRAKMDFLWLSNFKTHGGAQRIDREKDISENEFVNFVDELSRGKDLSLSFGQVAKYVEKTIQSGNVSDVFMSQLLTVILDTQDLEFKHVRLCDAVNVCFKVSSKQFEISATHNELMCQRNSPFVVACLNGYKHIARLLSRNFEPDWLKDLTDVELACLFQALEKYAIDSNEDLIEDSNEDLLEFAFLFQALDKYANEDLLVDISKAMNSTGYVISSHPVRESLLHGSPKLFRNYVEYLGFDTGRWAELEEIQGQGAMHILVGNTAQDSEEIIERKRYIVDFIMERCPESMNTTDKWGRTPFLLESVNYKLIRHIIGKNYINSDMIKMTDKLGNNILNKCLSNIIRCSAYLGENAYVLDLIHHDQVIYLAGKVGFNDLANHQVSLITHDVRGLVAEKMRALRQYGFGRDISKSDKSKSENMDIDNSSDDSWESSEADEDVLYHELNDSCNLLEVPDLWYESDLLSCFPDDLANIITSFMITIGSQLVNFLTSLFQNQLATKDKYQKLLALERNGEHSHVIMELLRDFGSRVDGYKILVEALQNFEPTRATQIIDKCLETRKTRAQLLCNATVRLQGSIHPLAAVFTNFSIPDALGIVHCEVVHDEFANSNSAAPVYINLEGDIPTEPPLYINRSVSSGLALSPNIFRSESCDIFVFKGFNMQSLIQLVKPNVIFSSSTQRGCLTSRYITLESDEDWKYLVENSKEPIHLICQEGEDIVLQKSTGCTDIIFRNRASGRKQQGSHLSENQFIDVLLGDEFKGAIICDIPGMGKSWLLQSLVRKICRAHGKTIPFYIKIRDLFAKISVSTKHTSNNEKLAAVLQICGLSKLGSMLISRYAKHSGFKIYLFCDGFDEIPDHHLKQTTNILRNLHSIENVRVTISSRLHMRHYLEKEFRHMQYDIVPFQKLEVVDALLSKWNLFGGAASKVEKLLDMSGIYTYLEEYNEETYYYFSERLLARTYIMLFGKKQFSTDISPMNEKLVNFYTFRALEVICPELTIDFKAKLLPGEEILRYGIMIPDEKVGFQFTHRTVAEYFVGNFFASFWANTKVYKPSFACQVGMYFVKTLLKTSDKKFNVNILDANQKLNALYHSRENHFSLVSIHLFLDTCYRNMERHEESFHHFKTVLNQYGVLTQFRKIIRRHAYRSLVACMASNLTSILSIIVNLINEIYAQDKTWLIRTAGNDFQGFPEYCADPRVSALYLVHRAALSGNMELTLDICSMFDDNGKNILTSELLLIPSNFITPIEVAINRNDVDMVCYFVDKVKISRERLFFKCLLGENMTEAELTFRCLIIDIIAGANVSSCLISHKLLYHIKNNQSNEKINFKLLRKVAISGFTKKSVSHEVKRALLEEAVKHNNDMQFIELLLLLFGDCSSSSTGSIAAQTTELPSSSKENREHPDSASITSPLNRAAARASFKQLYIYGFDMFRNISDVETLKILIKICPDFTQANRNGWNYTHIAVKNGHFEWVKYLIKAGFDYNQRDTYGNTPLLCISTKNSLEITRLLINCGTGQYAQNNDQLNIAHKLLHVFESDITADVMPWITYMLEHHYTDLWTMQGNRRYSKSPFEILTKLVGIDHPVAVSLKSRIKTSPETARMEPLIVLRDALAHTSQTAAHYYLERLNTDSVPKDLNSSATTTSSIDEYESPYSIPPFPSITITINHPSPSHSQESFVENYIDNYFGKPLQISMTHRTPPPKKQRREEGYMFSKTRAGVAFVACISHFDDTKLNREGVEIEQESMLDVAEHLGFDVMPSCLKKTRWTTKELYSGLDEVTKMLENEDNHPKCIMVFISSHGANKYLVASDGKYVDLERDIVEKLSKFSDIISVPKIFMFSSFYQRTVLTDTSGGKVLSSMTFSPNTAAVLSRVKNSEIGSRCPQFAHCLAYVVMKFGAEKSLQDMLGMVEKILAHDKINLSIEVKYTAFELLYFDK